MCVIKFSNEQEGTYSNTSAASCGGCTSPGWSVISTLSLVSVESTTVVSVESCDSVLGTRFLTLST